MRTISKLRIAATISAAVLAGAPGVSAAQSAAATGICPDIGRTLSIGSTGVDVANLQGFLAENSNIYPSGTVSGYFGVLTQRAVQVWQATYGVVASGSPATTGWGIVGPRTAAAMKASCTPSSQVLLQCPVNAQPASLCPGTWGPVRNQSGCVVAWECSFPLLGVSQASSSATTTVAATSSATTTCAPYTMPLCQGRTLHWNGTDQNGCNLGYQCD